MKMWIARDQSIRNIAGALFLYVNKPTSNGGIWYGGKVFYDIDNRLFPEVTFENSPLEVRLMREDVVNANYQSIADYEDFLGLVSFMRKAQRDQEITSARVMHKREQGYNLTDEDFTELANATNKVVELEEAVDKFIEERT